MNSTQEIIKAIKANPKVLNLILDSEYVNAVYKPRSKRRSQSKLALNHFWTSEEGAAFRLACEDLFGGESVPGLLRGREAKIKSAVFKLIIEYRASKGFES